MIKPGKLKKDKTSMYDKTWKIKKDKTSMNDKTV